MKILIFLMALLFWDEPNSNDKNTCSITVELSGMKQYSGIIGLMVFNQEDGFPTEKDKAFFTKEYPVGADLKEIKIDGLAPGRYAISIVHDVNGNRDLDKNIFGVPTEPFGFSGNKSILFGLPKFEEAAFDIEKGEVTSRIELIDLF